jgi:hypothetical protein
MTRRSGRPGARPSGFISLTGTPAKAIAAAYDLPLADASAAAVPDPAAWIIESFAIA